MEWHGIITGAVTVLIFHAIFNGDKKEDIEDIEENEDDNITNRYVTMSCQTCRKLKRHKEIEFNLFECAKCKRQVDIRSS